VGSVLGVGVFNSDGDMWQFHRRSQYTSQRAFYIGLTCSVVTRPFFARERVTDFRIFDSKANFAIEKMQERFEQGLAIDFQVGICLLFIQKRLCQIVLSRTFAAGSHLIRLVSFSWELRFVVSKIPSHGMGKTMVIYPRPAISSPAHLPMPSL
jgi:hypothetical protein